MLAGDKNKSIIHMDKNKYSRVAAIFADSDDEEEEKEESAPNKAEELLSKLENFEVPKVSAVKEAQPTFGFNFVNKKQNQTEFKVPMKKAESKDTEKRSDTTSFKFSKKRKYESTKSTDQQLTHSQSDSTRSSLKNVKRAKLNEQLTLDEVVAQVIARKTADNVKSSISGGGVQRGQTSKAFSDILLCKEW